MSTSSTTFSRLARRGSHASASSNGSVDLSSHNHILGHIRSIPALPTWLHDWVAEPHRHERIAVGATSRGPAVMTIEVTGIHHRPAGLRNVLDCVPVMDEGNVNFVGWRKKAWTFPSAKPAL